MTLQSVMRTPEPAGVLELCKRALAVAIDRDATPAIVEDMGVACEELKSCIREKVPERYHSKLDAELFDKLDLTTVKGRWVLCVAALGPLRADILHEMYKGFVAYNVSVLCKYQGDTMTDLFKALKGELCISSDPVEFLDEILASLREQWKGSNAEFIRQKVDEYIAELVILTIEEIDMMFVELASLIDGPMQSADELEAAGASAGVVGAARMMEEEAAKAQERPDELEARERIHAAVLAVLRATRSREHRGLEVPATPGVTQAWAMHPERLTVSTPAGDIPLIEGVMNEPLDAEQIVAAICRRHVTYAERMSTPS